MKKTSEAWVGQYAAFNEALKYMYRRSTGEEKSIYTPWPKFNDATTDGLEWNTLTVIGGRPGSGKTLMIVGLIVASLMPPNNPKILNSTQFTSIKYLDDIKAIKTNLILIPHNLSSQWYKAFTDNTRLKVKLILIQTIY